MKLIFASGLERKYKKKTEESRKKEQGPGAPIENSTIAQFFAPPP